MIDLAKLERIGGVAARQARDDLGDDVIAERRIQRIVIVPLEVGLIEVVAVFTVDQCTRRRGEAGGVGQRELMDELLAFQGHADVLVPPHLGVVVAGQVDDVPVLAGCEAPQGIEQRAIFGTRHRRRRAVVPRRDFSDAEAVEEIAGEDKLDRLRLPGEFLEQGGKIVRRLEDVAALVAADVAIGQEDEQRVVGKRARRGPRHRSLFGQAAVKRARTASGTSKLE